MGESAHDAATPQFVSSPEYEHAWLNPDDTQVARAEVVAAPAIKMLIRLPSATSADMHAALAPHLDGRADVTYSTNNGLIELSAPGVTKASGLAFVAERVGVEYSAILAFGDMPNDVPMLRMAGHGVAMGNGHPDARAAADEVTESNSADGVAGCSSAGGAERAGSGPCNRVTRAPGEYRHPSAAARTESAATLSASSVMDTALIRQRSGRSV